MPSYIRGLIDGDGSVGISKNGHPWLKISSSSKLFLQDAKYCCSFDLSINKSKTQTGYIYHLEFVGGKDKIYSACKKIYEHKNDFYLRRKYEKVQNKIS